MPAFVTDLINAAATRVQDPHRRRIQDAQWLSIYNEVQLELAIETLCLESDANFDIVGPNPPTTTVGETRYAYPDDAIVVNKIGYAAVPAGPNSYASLDEKFPDEWDDAFVRGTYPDGPPTMWIARQNFFQIAGAPTASILDGGQVTYRRIPEWLSVETVQVLEIPTFMSGVVVDGMVPRARFALKEHDQALSEYKMWQASLDAKRLRAEKRGDTRRRSALRTKSRSPFAEMLGG